MWTGDKRRDIQREASSQHLLCCFTSGYRERVNALDSRFFVYSFILVVKVHSDSPRDRGGVTKPHPSDISTLGREVPNQQTFDSSQFFMVSDMRSDGINDRK
jgi:hypothetical protein